MPLAASGEFARVSEMMETAREQPGQPVKRGTMAHDHDVMMQLTDAAAQRRDLAGLQRYSPQLEALAERDDHSLYLAIAYRGMGIAHRLSGEFGEAERDLGRSLEILQRLNAAWQLGRTYFELGELFREMNKPDEASANYAAALDSFEALRAASDIERTRLAMAGLIGQPSAGESGLEVKER